MHFWDSPADGVSVSQGALEETKKSALRLVTGVMIEIHEEWVTGKQYLDMTPLLERGAENE
jgi:hypothetical protein